MDVMEMEQQMSIYPVNTVGRNITISNTALLMLEISVIALVVNIIVLD